MALPSSITTIIVSGKYVGVDGCAATGSVTFTPSVAAATGGTLLPIAPTTITLDTDGAFSEALAATNDPDWTPSGFTYTVTERIDGAKARTYSITVPAASPGGVLDLATVVPVVPVTTVTPYILAAGGTMTGTLTLAGNPASALQAAPKQYVDTTAAAAAAAVPTLASGMWRSTPGPKITDYTVTVGTERAQLIFLPAGRQLSAIACWVVGTVASTTVRFGIRADAAGNQPGALLLDAGTAPATAGVASVAINYTVPATPASGVPLWLTVTPQGAGSVTFLGHLSSAEYRDVNTAANALNGSRSAHAQNGVTGALPAGFTTVSVLSTAPIVAVQGT